MKTPGDALQRIPPPTNREDAIDLMLDMREILVSLEPTPRRERILAGVRRWLRLAGWR